MVLSSLGNFIGIDADGGSRHDVYGEGGGHFVVDPLDGSLNSKLGSSELLSPPYWRSPTVASVLTWA